MSWSVRVIVALPIGRLLSAGGGVLGPPAATLPTVVSLPAGRDAARGEGEPPSPGSGGTGVTVGPWYGTIWIDRVTVGDEGGR
ncbi:hypothetical protein GCM10017556_09640 [Micromonospora sagamiensis]|nr:hypothetical protein GCM10017556_09640 [Micromonospora sagamiensis]